jgi:hypothetical protein
VRSPAGGKHHIHSFFRGVLHRYVGKRQKVPLTLKSGTL